MTQRPIVAGNWKMNLSHSQAHELAWNCDQIALSYPGVQIGVFPSSIYVGEIARISRVDGALMVGAQNCHWESAGAFTGEVSPQQLVSAGVDSVLIGHSERRSLFNEGEEVLRKKLDAALEAGLHVIYCVGETLAEREAGQAQAVVRHQLDNLRNCTSTAIDVAYEPVWAIGTDRTASPAQAGEMCSLIKTQLGAIGLASARVLYGGSVTPENASELAAAPGVSGFLVGGASLNPDSFLAIVQAMAANL